MCCSFKNGVDYTIVWWIRATLEGRLAAATLGGSSKRVAVSKSSPQGSVLSPFLLCLVDDFTVRRNGGGMYTQGYAVNIYYSGGGDSQIRYTFGAKRLGYRLMPAKLGLLYSQREGNSLVSVQHTF